MARPGEPDGIVSGIGVGFNVAAPACLKTAAPPCSIDVVVGVELFVPDRTITQIGTLIGGRRAPVLVTFPEIRILLDRTILA